MARRAARSLVTFGVAIAFVPITLAANVGINPADAGLASGLVNTNQQVGAAIELAAMVTIAASRTSAFTGHSHAAADQWLRPNVRGLRGLVVLAGVIAATVLPRHLDQRRTQELENFSTRPLDVARDPVGLPHRNFSNGLSRQYANNGTAICSTLHIPVAHLRATPDSTT